ncbi:hypothetical protein D8I30_12335 [Brevundimonas naejangsanensis]|uniref:Uncharacterized protein n=1 Tax=Brevundimonas naejangsanensis TaxID=588932 RepID=A0A494RQR8_9CAUL|nr:hypothetical protein [Brevundimonas naejangsanensis]AYG95874.1 hypothetical protein D8I30_12335 [Brevundimonas naejangsanensis]
MEKSAPRRRETASLDPVDYPIREYVAAMAMELAGMARWDGDERLAGLLESAADLARRTASA